MKPVLSFLLVFCLGLGGIAFAADHRDAPTVNEDAAGDINDVFAFVDPTNPSRLVLAMTVSPFAVPQVGGYAFGREILYQIKIDNNGDAKEDFVIQMMCTGTGATQSCQVWGPVQPPSSFIGVRNRIVTQIRPIAGTIGSTFGDAVVVQAFAGLREDPFAFDVGQFNRILGGTQDVFRQTQVAALGATFRGRTANAQGRSGFDSFGGFNTLVLAVGFPKAMVRGDGRRINVWATTSRQAKDEISQNLPLTDRTFVQFERMGQAAFNTVFVPSSRKDEFNTLPPDRDVAYASELVPNALISTDLTSNTIAGRAGLLTLLGLTTPPAGAPLLLPGAFTNTNPDLLRVALLPDVIRLDLDLPSGELAIGQFGLLNGRRPADDVIDILLQLARQLADVTFPPSLGVPGSGQLRPGSLDFATDRRVYVVLQGTDFIKADADLLDYTKSGNDRAFATTFPYFGLPHPQIGEPGTVGFPTAP